MNKPTAQIMLLGLPRPQYVSVPEAFISALASQLYDVDLRPDSKGRKVALTYRFRPKAKEPATLAFRATAPVGDQLGVFGYALKEHGVRAEEGQERLAQAIAEALSGVSSTKGGVQAAIPLSPSLALLQNLRGLQSAANPPALGKIIERLFALGALEASEPESAASLWHAAALVRSERDPLVRAIDRAASDALFDVPPVRNQQNPAEEVSAGYFPGTPFEWFHENWRRLCSDEWVGALPARVWVDWANTVLRLALGLGYLWEVAWFESLARRIALDDLDVGWDALLAGVPEAMPWKSRTADVSVRDVASPLAWRVRRGDQVRALLSAWVARNGVEQHEALSVLRAMAQDNELVTGLTDALASRATPGSANNLWEAIKYALKTREVSGPHADHYGLLHSSGRYLTPEPGVEWIAAVSGLACGQPGGESNVGTLLRQLRKLGTRPELGELVGRLEQAGVARGSADADHAVGIRAAF